MRLSFEPVRLERLCGCLSTCPSWTVGVICRPHDPEFQNKLELDSLREAPPARSRRSPSHLAVKPVTRHWQLTRTRNARLSLLLLRLGVPGAGPPTRRLGVAAAGPEAVASRLPSGTLAQLAPSVQAFKLCGNDGSQLPTDSSHESPPPCTETRTASVRGSP